MLRDGAQRTQSPHVERWCSTYTLSGNNSQITSSHEGVVTLIESSHVSDLQQQC